MKKIQTAILFQKKKLDNDIIIEIPTRILFGNATGKSDVFKDTISNNTYINSDIVINSDIDLGFQFVEDFKHLVKNYKTKDIKKLFPMYLKDIRKNVYYYEEEECIMSIMPLNEFYEMYGIAIKYSDSSETLSDLEEMLSEKLDEIESDNVEEKVNTLKISAVCSEVKKTVIAQDDAVKKIVTAIYKNNMFDDPKMKSNIFVYGSTGVGKTEIVRTLGDIFKLPVLIEDMSSYTSSGYKGASIEDILERLYRNANGDLALAQRSILVLDEIDKKASIDSEKDFNKKDVLKELLKVIEGATFSLRIGTFSTVNFDTSKLTIIVCGAYSDMLNKICPTRNVGFESDNTKITKQEFELKDFIDYGMPQEFIGRFDTLVKLNSLTEEDLVRILKESDKSPIKVYLNNLKLVGSNLEISDSIYEKIAHRAIKYNTGARALKIVVDELFNEIIYDIFDNPLRQATIEIDEETITDNKHYKVKELSM